MKETAMSKLLYVISSPRGEQSESTKIADEFLTAYLNVRPGIEVQRLNLWDDQLPIYGGKGAAAKMTVFSGQTPEGDQAEAWADVERVFAPFRAADEYLFTVPMWNAGVPWVLKHLIDTITQPGLVFGFDPAQGYMPLLENKRAVVVYTSGVYSVGASIQFATDFHAEFFNDWLRFIGVADVSEIRFQPTVLTADPDAARNAALTRARHLATELAAPATKIA
jgi:FMN-dependent NADH-azoreductase